MNWTKKPLVVVRIASNTTRMENAMKASVFGICRAKSCVYVGIAVTSQKDEAPIENNPVITVSADNGTPLMFRQHTLSTAEPGKERRFSLAVPLLLNAPLSIGVENADGSPIDGAPISISPSRAKWESRLTYRLKKKAAGELRFDEEGSDQHRIEIEFEHLIPAGGNDLLRAFFKTPYYPDSVHQIECYDSYGHLVESKPVFLGDNRYPAPYNPKALIRERSFSIRVPESPQSLTLAIIDESHPELSDFLTVAYQPYDELMRRSEGTWRDASQDPGYHDWFLRHRASQSDLASQRATAFENGPLFSIIVPLYRTPLRLFGEMVASVTAQSYDNWELVLVNASPSDIELSKAASDAAAGDERIKVVTLEKNLGITENTNEGIAACQGDFVCFLDHDDFIEPDTLFEYACALEKHPTADLVYCDEDKCNEDASTFFCPFFKTDFDLFLLRCYNYVCHFLCVRKAVLDELDPATAEFDGAQDHNLTFRIAERAREVLHVQKLLYHWRITEQSTAAPTDADGNLKKTYAEDAGRLAIANHLERLGIDASIEPTAWPFVHHVKYHVKGTPTVSIVIPNKDYSDMLETCVHSILEKTTYPHYEIVIVDNNSVEPETPACYKRLEQLDERISVVTWPDDFNFSKIVNFGAKHSTGEYLLFLNNDTEVIAPEWLENMLGICQLPDVGAVGAKLYYEDDSIQHAGVVITGHFTAAHHAFYGLTDACLNPPNRTELTRQFVGVTAACMLVKRSDYDAVGGFDEDFSVAYNDVDFCFKLLEKGLRNVYEPSARLYHYESISRGTDFTSPEKRTRLYAEESLLHERWPAIYIVGDPFMNPNLTTHNYLLRY